MENITIENLYDLKETIAADLFTEAEYPWEVLPRIHDFILELGKRLPEEIYEKEARISGWQRAQQYLTAHICTVRSSSARMQKSDSAPLSVAAQS